MNSKKPIILLLIIILIPIIGCSSFHGVKEDKQHDKLTTLTWDAPATNVNKIDGYKVYYGTSSRIYTQSIDVGNVTTYTIENLPSGTWYFAVTAYDISGNESIYSVEVSKKIE